MIAWARLLLAVVLTIGLVVLGVALGTGRVMDSQPLMLIVGGLVSTWSGIVGYYFGTSVDHRRALELLQQAMPPQQPPS